MTTPSNPSLLPSHPHSAQSISMSCPSSPSLPPLKRPRITAPSPTSLLSLPDEILAHILRQLCHPSFRSLTPPFLHGVALQHTRHAFALACCCKRLFHLFCAACLSHIDGTHGSLSTRDYFYNPCFPRSPCQHPRHLHTVATLAGESLREFKLPMYGRILFSARHVLRAVADHCPNVERLSFPDSVDTDQTSMECLFDTLKRLIVLCICAPATGTLKALWKKGGTKLRVLELSDVSPKLAMEICGVVSELGKRLEVLSVVYDLDKQMMLTDILQGEVRLPCVWAFLAWVDKNLRGCCPRLKVLEVGVSSSVGFVHDYEYMGAIHGVQYFTFVNDVLEWLPKRSCVVDGLDVLRIGCQSEDVMRCVKLMTNVISSRTRVEISVPSACVVFPRMALEKEFVYFKCFQLNRLCAVNECLTIEEKIFDKLEFLDLGPANIVRHYASSMMSQLGSLWSICARAGSNLKSVRMNVSLGFGSFIERARRFLLDLLDMAPGVQNLELSREMVRFVKEDRKDAEIVGKMLSGLRTLRLSAPERYCKGNMPTKFGKKALAVNFEFSRRLPAFLDLIVDYCSNMEGIYLDKAGVIIEVGATKGLRCPRMKVRTALAALEDFGRARPEVDIATIETQLRIWLEQCS